MAANLAMIALSKGVPLATDAFAKYYPKAVKSAKQYVGKAIGSEPASVNLKEIARQNGGMYSQVVAEAMVKNGMPVDAFMEHYTVNIGLSRTQIAHVREMMMSIQVTEEAESDAKAMGTSLTVDATIMLNEKIDSINTCCAILGCDAADLWRLKVEMDHLHKDDITNYQTSFGNLRPTPRRK